LSEGNFTSGNFTSENKAAFRIQKTPDPSRPILLIVNFVTSKTRLEDSAEVNVNILDSAQRVHLLGLEIHNLTMAETLLAIGHIVERKRFAYAVTPNVDHIVKFRKSAQFRELYRKAELVVADGVPLIWASRMIGTPLKERINGTDLFERTCQLAAQRGYSVFLLGGSTRAASSACAQLSQRHPDLRIAGWDCPPFGFYKNAEQNKAIQERIRASGATILFVGLGAPQQEQWMCDCAEGSGVTFAIGVGVSFSFVGGLIPRAPLWMQRNGLEWLWRLVKEPRRLWKRYLVEDLQFFGMLLGAVLKRASSQRKA
jgi:N-acetylglucosaminyldiphosphoundecaprenol N-acetyl-beta-D-mannosaminyltransferase